MTRSIKTVGAGVSAAVALLAASCGGNASSAPEATPTDPAPLEGRVRSESAMHAKHLYVGVSCNRGNEIGCDGIGLSVVVPSEPDFVEADVAGSNARLDRVTTGENAPAIYQGRIEKPGLLHEGPLAVIPEPNGKWIGRRPVRFPMTLRAIYRDTGKYTEQAFNRVPLSPGFG